MSVSRGGSLGYGIHPLHVAHRSDVELAIACRQLRDAERLIGRALAGNPPDDIADELRDLLLDEIYAQRQAIGH